MGKSIAFIGHRLVLAKDLKERLMEVVEDKIKNGYDNFYIGTRGSFDELALQVCSGLRYNYNINIYIVITSLNMIKAKYEKTDYGYEIYTPYDNFKTVMFEIEEVHFKKRIIVSNQKMVDNCDLLIAYADLKAMQSGARRVVNYATKQGKEVINLYRDDDDPFFNKTREELDKMFVEYYKGIKKL